MTPSLHRLLLIAALLGGATVASAQETPAPAPVAKEEPAEAQATGEEEEDDDGTIQAIRLEAVEVTGSRIRRIEVEGPSPVSSYDKDYIRSTGAMNVADFLNTLPQTYSGIGAGRASTPNDLNPEFGQRTETTSPLFNLVLGASAAPPGQTGVSGVSLRGLGSGSTLVLVDGRRVGQSGAGNRSSDTRQGFVDLNTIPLGMIERIEIITDGASAIYGADAVAGVVNIILKKDWTGSELTGSFKGSEHGGGRERSIALTSGFAAGKLRGTVSATYYDRSSLKADQRSFTRNQDHRDIIAGYNPTTGAAIYGRDLRINWGYPATVQARVGTLAGFFRPDGVTPTNVALTPEGYATTPPLSAFTGQGPVPPNTGVFATQQRRGNTAEFLDLIPESERWGIAANFTYEINERLEFFGDINYTDTRSKADTQPPVSSAAASSGFGNFATIVPAALNPFGQDVLVGMVHYEFGSIWQKMQTKAQRGHFGVRGDVGETWRWDLAFGFDRQKAKQLTRDFNGAGITALLASGALNPFIDSRADGAPDQSGVYTPLAIYPKVDSNSRLITWDFVADGRLFELSGGPLQMAWGANFNRVEVDARAQSYSSGFGGLISNISQVQAQGDNYGLFTELSVPLIGKANARSGAQRLELQLAARYEDYSTAEPVTLPKYGISWAPLSSVLVRASYSEGFRPPGLTENLIPTTTGTQTVTDPRRNPASTTGVIVTSGSRPVMDPETSETLFYGVVIEPPFAKGLNLQINYYETSQRDVLQQLSPNTIVLNETLFADRIVRAPADAQDTALGQPGRILSVDRTFVSFGEMISRSMDYTLDYTLPWQNLGRWRIGFTATRTLESSRQLAPGQPPITQEDDTLSPPKWKYNASLFWNQGSWNASLFFYHIDSFLTNSGGNWLATHPIASAQKVDVRVGYEFKNGIVRGYGKGLRVQAGIGNVFDEEPPFSDTVYGYNGGLHSQWVLGRSYELSFVMPF